MFSQLQHFPSTMAFVFPHLPHIILASLQFPVQSGSHASSKQKNIRQIAQAIEAHPAVYSTYPWP
jgi:hypothetical protein